jgi:hypothetical protein
MFLNGCCFRFREPVEGVLFERLLRRVRVKLWMNMHRYFLRRAEP